jgi:hypothetical protein
MPLTESWGPIMWFAHLMAGKLDDVFNFPRVKGDASCWSSVRLGVAGLLAGSCRFPFSTLRPAILLLENFNLSVRSSLLSFLLTSLSYSCGLAPLAAVACPSTLLPLSYSFLTLPCSIPCPEVTFTSPRIATPQGTAKSPH